MRGVLWMLATFAASGGVAAWLLPPAPLWTSTDFPDAAAWSCSDDGAVVAAFARTASVGRLRVVDGDSGLLVRNVVFDWREREDLPRPKGAAARAAPATVVLDPRGTLAAVVGGRGPAALVDLGDEGSVRRFPKPGGGPAAFAAQFLDDGALLVWSGAGPDDRTLSAWDFRADSVRWSLRGIQAFALSEDRARLATCEAPGGRVIFRNAATADEQAAVRGLPDASADGAALAFAPDSQTLRVRQAGGVWTVDAATAQPRGGPAPDPEEAALFPHLLLATNGRWLIAESERRVLGAADLRRWTDPADGGAAASQVAFFPHGAAAPACSLPVWMAAGQRAAVGVVASADGRRCGVESRARDGERRFEWHSVPGAGDWQLAAAWALLPTIVAGLVSWRRGWLRIVPPDEELRP